LNSGSIISSVSINRGHGSSSKHLSAIPKLAFVLALLLAGAMWFYVQQVMIAHQLSDAALYGIPRGNLSDLYPRWLGARELLLHHRDPYSAEVTREIQIGYYGRVLDPAHLHDPADQQGFAYPVYIVFLLAPTIGLPFAIVQTGFRWLLVALTAACVPVWLRVFRRRASAWAAATIVVLLVGSLQALQGIKLQQLTLLVAALVAFSALLLQRDRLAAAGVLLALATIKPQLVLLLSSWLLLWALSDWRKRKAFVWGFAGTLLVLVVAGEIVLPGWLGHFYQAVIAYRHYNNGAESTLELLFTPVWGRAVAAVIILGLVIICWRFRHVSKDAATFHWIFVTILAATNVVAPKQAPYNQLLLLAPVLLVVSYWPVLWASNTSFRAALAITTLILTWPWLAAFGITVASLFLANSSLQGAWQIPLYFLPLVPLLMFAVVAFASLQLLPRSAADIASARGR